MISSIFKELILYGKTCVKYILPRYFVDKIPRQYFVKSYSQEGEDMILRRLFERKDKGVYIDVGAHHPKKFSNTYYFYKKGWSGINLDAMPGSMLRFDKVRPRDLNIETAISDTKETLKYFIFNNTALNGFDRTLSKERENVEEYHVVSYKYIETKTLNDILNLNNSREFLENRNIDFLTVDVEGYDFNVLRSIDLNNMKYRPKVILVEILHNSLVEIQSNDIVQYLYKKGFDFYAKTINTTFFIDTKSHIE